MRSLSAVDIDKQTRRSYASDRLPGIGLDRNGAGKSARGRLDKEERERRRRERRCFTCEGPILGRPETAVTCLVHRQFPGPPRRPELIGLIAEHEALLVSLRGALAAMDQAEEASE